MIKIAVVTKSATTKSGARVPFELATYLAKFHNVLVFAQKKNTEKNLEPFLKSKNVQLIFYQNPIDLLLKLRKEKVDIISFHATLSEAISAKLALKPIVQTYYGTQFDAYLEKFTPDQKISFYDTVLNRILNYLIWLNKKILSMLATKVIAISKYTQKELKKLFSVNSKVIYLGVSLKPKNLNRDLSSVNHKPVILSISRFTPYKGFHHLIEAVEKLRRSGLPIKLIIAGSLGKKRYLEYLQRIKNKNNQILVNVSDKQLINLYRKCDIYASCDRYLFFGLPIAEAAYFAKPAIALNFAAAKELIVHKKSGFVAQSTEELYKYLKILVGNPQLRHKMGIWAMKNARKQFDWTQITLLYKQVFVEILNK